MDPSLAAIQGDQVAGGHHPADAAQTGHRRDIERARENGRVSGAAPGFRDDPGDVEPLEHEGLRGQDFRRDDDDRFIGFQECARRLVQGELSQDAGDHVAQIRQALLQILIVEVLEQLGIFFEDLVQTGADIDLFLPDCRLDLGGQRRVAHQQAVAAKIAASSSPSCWPTLATMASSSAPAACTAVSKRAISDETLAASISCGSRGARASSTQYARATTTPGETAIPFSMLSC